MNQLISSFFAMWTPGIIELVVILIVALLIFGKRIPEIMRGFGKSMGEFKKGLTEAKDIKDELEDEIKKIKDDIIK